MAANSLFATYTQSQTDSAKAAESADRPELE